MLKGFINKLRYMIRSLAMHKYRLHLESVRLGLIPCQERLVHKITVVSTDQFNFFIDFEWSNNGLADNSNP